MDPLALIAVAVFGPVAIALAALRFGVHTGPALATPDEIRTAHGMRWDGHYVIQPPTRRVAIATPPISPAPVETTAFPTLARIDRLHPEALPYAADPNAARLERLARELTDEYWPDSVWLTGMVSPAQLDAVVSRLDAERQRGHDAIRLLIATETGEGIDARA